ncbi:MAG: hypothetical protein IPP94_16125 [Ignavibacteria bacterium]|nr:hypothetical protein [Ignavibacteria bacterium]
MEYPRVLVAAAPSLQFEVSKEMGEGARIVSIDSLQGTTPLILRRRGGQFSQLAPLSFAAGRLRFADTLFNSARYIVCSSDSLAVPNPGSTLTVERLRATDRQAQYLLITAAQFAAESDQYAAFIRQQYGVDTRVVTVESIYDNYSYGVFNPEAIKVFLFDTWTTWTQKPPQNVFLVGDANYNYKAAPSPQSKNFVPSYGFPVSDIWFVAFDAPALEPSYAIGRLTAHSGSEVLAYLEKHRKMLTQAADVFNKSTIHFSGGTSQQPQEKLDELRAINDAVINEAVLPKPYAGKPVHFYKTKVPQTDFGPYTPAFVQETIDDGGLVISYIGHAAIRTWDNTIGDPSQLRNTKDRASLVSDFGCSTSKFADPDGAAFAELFVVPEGTQSIAYVGNAAIGFTSTAAVMPVLFYKALLKDGASSIGDAHRRSKLDLARLYGTSTVNKVAIQSNSLIGDPIARLPVPHKPNVVARAEWVRQGEEIFTNAMDSLGFIIAWANLGTLRGDSVTVTVRDVFAGATRISREYRRALPSLFDTIRVTLPSGNLAGNHLLEVLVDSDDRIDEGDERDNLAQFSYAVLSTHLQVVNAAFGRSSAGFVDARLLNPMLSPGEVQDVEFQFDLTSAFLSPLSMKAPYGKTVTEPGPLPPLTADRRWYWRARLDTPGAEFVGPFEFWSTTPRAPFVQRDSIDLARNQREKLFLDSGGLTNLPGRRTLSVISSGYNDGGYGSVELDGRNILPTTFGRGYFVVILDSVSIDVDTIAIYDTYENPDASLALNRFLLALPFGKIVAISTMDDPYFYHSDLIAGMRSIGSRYADTLGVYARAFRGNFAIIGRHGAKIGSVQEAFNPKFGGKVTLDTSYVADADTGSVTSVTIGPASAWRSIRLQRSSSASSIIALRVYGVKSDGSRALLRSESNPDTLGLSFVNAAIHPKLQLEADLIPQAGKPFPVLRGWDVDYQRRAELALNYQSVTVTPDSVEQGIDVRMTVGIVNAGETDAGPFSVIVDAVGSDNIRKQLFRGNVAGLARGAWLDTALTVSTTSLPGVQRLLVQVDREDAVPEQFETNNVAITRIAVQRDTIIPSLSVLFDGHTPPEGDYIRPTPLVTMTLSDASPLKVTNPANFSITLDDSTVSTAGLQFTPMTSTVPALLQWTPALETGEHVFRFNARDASGNPALSEDLIVRVLVDLDGKILDLTNYPNPFADATAFVFTLTGSEPPDVVEVKLYTVTGRLIRRLAAGREQLRIGLNMLRWDGRDEDGDLPGNGVYFYKFITRSPTGVTETLGKIAKLK